MARAGLLAGVPDEAPGEPFVPFENGGAPVLRGPAVIGLEPLGGGPVAGNGAAADATLEGLRAAMAEAALL
jgi:hypothetical protein